MAVRVYVKGISKVNKLLKTLPIKINEEMSQNATRKIAESAQRRIKYRYNVAGWGRSEYASHSGQRNIKVVKTPRGYGVAVPEYLEYIETPIASHPVARSTLERHKAIPGSTLHKKAPYLTMEDRIYGPIMFVWKGPFIRPGIKATEQDIPKIIRRSLNKAIKASGG